jgi:hypothetical protein
LPVLAFLIFRNKQSVVLLIAFYGVFFFVNLAFLTDLIPVEYQRLYNSLYTFAEYTFFTAILWFNVSSKRLRKIFYISYLIFIPFQVLYYFFLKGKFDAVPVGIETLFVFIYIFLFFYEYFKNVYTEYIYNYYCFWIAVGIMLYLSSSFFLYLLANDVTQDQLDSFWHYTYVGETIKNILFAVAVLIYSRNKSKENIPNQNIPYLDYN